MPKYNTGPISHNDETQAGQMNFTQESIEALHRRVLFGYMVIGAVAEVGGTQSDAAADNTGRPFWCQKDFQEEGQDECHVMKLHGAPFILLVGNGSAKHHRNAPAGATSK